MSNSFILTLDTTPPVVEIYAPSYTVPNILTEITVKANEALAQYQEIYIIDSINVRHDMVFQYNGDRYTGSIYCDYPVGIATIYVRLMDTVDNISSVYSKSMNILSVGQVGLLNIKMAESIMGSSMSEQTRGIDDSAEEILVTVARS